MFKSGQQVIWKHVPRGGYGFPVGVPATVVKTTAKRVTIDALLKSGRTVRKVVKPENLLASHS